MCMRDRKKEKEKKSKVLAVMAFDAGVCLVESPEVAIPVKSLAQTQSDPRIISNCL